MQTFPTQAEQTLYESILSGNHYFEAKVDINGTSYYKENIFSMSTKSDLFNEFSVGNSTARQIDVVLWNVDPNNIPIMATLNPYIRVVDAEDDTRYSGWIAKGKFFIDTRKYDKDTDKLTLQGFDAILKTETVYDPTGTIITPSSPKTCYEIANAIATRIGTTLESDTATLLQGLSYTFTVPPVVGTDGTSCREFLEYIGSLVGSNWITNDIGELKLVGFSLPYETFLLINEQNDYIVFGTGANATRIKTDG